LVEFDEDFQVNLTDPKFDGATDANRIVIGDGQGIGTIGNNDFGTFSGVIFNDLNQDGVKDANEQGIFGVTVTLESTDMQGVLLTTTTAADGTYQFTNIGPGEYQLIESQPTGFFDLDFDSAPIGTVVNDPVNDKIIDIVFIEKGMTQAGFDFSELLAVDLGELVFGGGGNGFALLGLTDTKIKLKNATVKGDLGVGPTLLDPKGVLGTFKGNNLVDGDVYIDPSSSFGKIFANDITGGIFKSDMAGAVADALAASAMASSLTATQTFTDIAPTSISPDFSITGNGGINVIQVDGDIILKSGQTLTLVGGSSDVFIINVSGKLLMKGNAGIVLDGVLAENVLWNFPGGGGNIKGSSDSVMFGTVLAPSDDVVWKGTINGALIGGGSKLKLVSGGSTINYVPSILAEVDPMPSPAPVPVASSTPDTGTSTTNESFSEQVSTGNDVQKSSLDIWASKPGKKLIRKLNGSSKSTLLGNHLASSSPNLLGGLAGMSNEQISIHYNDLYQANAQNMAVNASGKLELETLAAALEAYVTDLDLVQLQYDSSSADNIARDSDGNPILDDSLVDEITSLGFLVTSDAV
ncbi:MAG: hypothetical protein KDA36_03225, partial [Planctomycetaceae bacterium]|nr:hypothetical protein [Planctomycetaceae bacterium]